MAIAARTKLDLRYISDPFLKDVFFELKVGVCAMRHNYTAIKSAACGISISVIMTTAFVKYFHKEVLLFFCEFETLVASI
jgi:hypothetical protein